MVVAEVLKDIETACKLPNITAGEPLLCQRGHREWARPGALCHSQRCWCFSTLHRP